MVLLVQTERIKETLKRYSSLNIGKDISEYLKSDFIPHSVIIDISASLKNINHDIQKKEDTLDYILRGTYIYHEKKTQKNNTKQNHLLKMHSIAQEIDYQRLIGIHDPYYKNKELSKTELRLIKNQIFTIINILVTIFSIIIAIWIWCKNWNIPMRIIAALSSGILIAIAEIVLYNHYLSSIKKRQDFQRNKPIKKEIINSIKFQGKNT
ncbi:hypothetical protein T552_02107 [Pneumocystis carinii B80]|uniref:Uncharacterized protein n=1 Tax=Pneumocystis carinii (strain B80) TaxID=1408658 RepID=A0A0W4ZH24_PNEC8|nr:hypothetical protein T552_02107 [Pneumocystis carinii B80]KTW27667.1 hypothetical protein T552_02107 [Pneumocystis carinii B80]